MTLPSDGVGGDGQSSSTPPGFLIDPAASPGWSSSRAFARDEYPPGTILVSARRVPAWGLW